MYSDCAGASHIMGGNISMEESSGLRSSPHLTGTMGGRGGTRRSSREGDGGRGGGEDAMIVIAGPGGEKVSIARCPAVLKYGLWR
jgi:hypothetical protein